MILELRAGSDWSGTRLDPDTSTLILERLAALLDVLDFAQQIPMLDPLCLTRFNLTVEASFGPHRLPELPLRRLDTRPESTPGTPPRPPVPDGF